MIEAYISMLCLIADIQVCNQLFLPLLPTPHSFRSRKASIINLLFLFLLITILLLLSGLGLLSSDTSIATTTKWRGKGEVDVLLGVETDDERGNVNDLLADTVKRG